MRPRSLGNPWGRLTSSAGYAPAHLHRARRDRLHGAAGLRQDDAGSHHRRTLTGRLHRLGIKEVREVIEKAGTDLKMTAKKMILFIDEIRRLPNKAQQDVFLSFVEDGTIGATTENPSFEVNSALLSRTRVYALFGQLTDEDLAAIIRRALADQDRGLGGVALTVDEDARPLNPTGMLHRASGSIWSCCDSPGPDAVPRDARGCRGGDVAARPDVPQGRRQTTIISALHKSVRDSDPDAALYWLSRMLKGRQLLMSAHPNGDRGRGTCRSAGASGSGSRQGSLPLHGSPEESGPGQFAVIWRAPPKSKNAASTPRSGRWTRISRSDVRCRYRWSSENAPTRLMKDIGYGKGYKYAHSYADAVVDQQRLPTCGGPTTARRIGVRGKDLTPAFGRAGAS